MHCFRFNLRLDYAKIILVYDWQHLFIILDGECIMDAQEKEKKLKLMRYWLFGAFAIFFPAVTVYFGMIAQAFGLIINESTSIFTSIHYWIFMAILALLCVGAFYFYKWYIERK